MKTFGDVNRDSGTVFQGRADPPEVIEMLVAENPRLDLALLQQPIDAFLGEAAIHPFRVPAGVEQEAAYSSIARLCFQERRKAGCVICVQRAERRPGDGVLIGLCATGSANVVEHGGGVVPAGFG